MSEMEVPEGWKKLDNLSDVIETLESGKRPTGGVKGISEGIPSLGGEHLNYNGKFNFKQMRFVPVDFFKNMTNGHIKKNDVLIVKDGATTGKTSYVDEDFPYDESCVNEHVFIMRPNDDVLSKYLFYFMRSNFSQILLSDKMKGDIGGINKTFTKDFPIVFPIDKKIQEKIIEKLDDVLGQLDKKKIEIIFSYNKIICELFSPKKNFNIEQNISNFINYTFNQIIHAAFEGKYSSDPNSFDNKKYEKLLKKLDEKKKTYTKRSYHENVVKTLHSSYDLPKKWSWARFDSFSELISGQHILANDYNLTKNGMPYITGPADFGNISPTITKWTEKPKAKAKKNDILITVKGAGVGKVNSLDIDVAAISRQLMAIRSDNVIPLLVYYYLSSQHHNLAKLAGDWTTVPGIGRESILQLEIPLIPEELQKETLDAIQEKLKKVVIIENKLKTIFSNYKNSIKTIEKMNYSVLNSAFSGKLLN
jgi:type I restriction enzyme, S subunit